MNGEQQKPAGGLLEKLGRHLRVFGYAAVFGLGAYGVINLLIYLFRSLGSAL